jgi:hypothetical protein
MNHIQLLASSATARCKRFIQFLISNLRVKGFIQQILNYAQPVDNFAHKFTSCLRHAERLWKLDWHDILQARALKGAHTAPLKRVARWVALGLVGALCLPMSHATSGSIDAINPKTYIKLSMDHKQANCLLTLYGKESAFNQYAIGNLKGKYHVYGIPQLKNPIIYEKSAVEQVRYGIKYIRHRYNGDTCMALHHWKVWGWH